VTAFPQVGFQWHCGNWVQIDLAFPLDWFYLELMHENSARDNYLAGMHENNRRADKVGQSLFFEFVLVHFMTPYTLEPNPLRLN